MNLVDRTTFAPSRSVTAKHSDAPARVARWVDWFRLATYVLIGEPLASRWRDLFFLDSWPGTVAWTQTKLTYANTFVARTRPNRCCRGCGQRANACFHCRRPAEGLWDDHRRTARHARLLLGAGGALGGDGSHGHLLALCLRGVGKGRFGSGGSQRQVGQEFAGSKDRHLR